MGPATSDSSSGLEVRRLQVEVTGSQGSLVGDHATLTQTFVTNNTTNLLTGAAPATHGQAQVCVGLIPALASAFQPRRESRREVDRARNDAPGGVVLTQVLTGNGGIGKSQLAAAYAHEHLALNCSLVLWVTATSRAAVCSAYAEAAERLGLVPPTGAPAPADLLELASGVPQRDPEAEQEAMAKRLLNWLATTPCSWIIVLDDVTDPENVAGLWPPPTRGNGWVLATTRRRDPRFTGGGRKVVEIDVYSRGEAEDYLRQRLLEARREYLLDDGVGELVEALGRLPLALGHAAAYLIHKRISCRTYLGLLRDSHTRLDQLMPTWADTEEYGRAVGATLLLAVEAVEASAEPDQRSMVRPALMLCAMLDPAGHPEALWSTEAVRRMLRIAARDEEADEQDEPGRPDGPDAAGRDLLTSLNQFGLLTVDDNVFGSYGARVRMHNLTQRAVREQSDEETSSDVATIAAQALDAFWSETDFNRELSGVMRANAMNLAQEFPSVFWDQEFHDLPYQYSVDLLNSGAVSEAAAFLEHATELKRTAATNSDDLQVAQWLYMTSLLNLGDFFRGQRVGQDLLARMVAEGAEDHETLPIRLQLTIADGRLGNNEAAVVALQRLLTELDALEEEEGLETFRSMTVCAILGCRARSEDPLAIVTEMEPDITQQLSAFSEQDPNRLLLKLVWAEVLHGAGRTEEARQHLVTVVDVGNTLLPPGNQLMSNARRVLASLSRPSTAPDEADDAASAVEEAEPVPSELEALLREMLETLGADHPEVLATRLEVGMHLMRSQRYGEALTVAEALRQDLERVLGPEHPHVFSAQSLAADALSKLGRYEEALTRYDEVITEMSRSVGLDNINVLGLRFLRMRQLENLDRYEDVLEDSRELIVDQVRVLGPDARRTLLARYSYAKAHLSLGRHEEACVLLEQQFDDEARVLGPEHLDTLTTLASLSDALSATNRLERALQVMQDAARGRARVLGANHETTLRTRKMVARQLSALGRHEEAIGVLRGVLADLLQVDVPQSEDALTVRNSIAWELTQLDDHLGALADFRAVAIDRQALLGPDHASTRLSLNWATYEESQVRAVHLLEGPSRVEALMAEGRVQEALGVLSTSLSVAEVLTATARHHGDAAPLLRRRAHLLRTNGRVDEALDDLRRLTDLHDHYGVSGPLPVEDLHDLANLLLLVGDDAGAAMAHARALQITRETRAD